jgi:hypothetical protein
VLIRTNSRLRRTEILRFSLLASETVWRGRTPFYAINSNRFEKPWEFSYKAKEYNDETGKMVEMNKIITREGPSRKIFMKYLPELLKEKLLTRIKTSDERSKYYSITPLGICHLIKSAEDDDAIKYPWPERQFIIYTLQTFAAQNVKPYRSLIFDGQKFISYDANLWDDLAKWLGISLRHQIVHVFSNIDLNEKKFKFSITTGYDMKNKINIATFNLENDQLVIINELNKVPFNKGIFYSDTEYKSLELNDEQFHNYLANLMICSLVFDSSLAEFDMDLIRIKNKKIRKKDYANTEFEKIKHHPEYFKKILLVLSKHAEIMVNRQHELIYKYRKVVNESQFIQN